MKHWQRLLAACIGIGFAAMAQAQVKVTCFRIEESRRVAFVDDKIGRVPEVLNVTLSLKGPEADASARCGNIKIEEAVDDKGASLILPKDSFYDNAKFKEYANAFFRKFDLENKKPAADPQVEISLAKSQRAATKIARLRGSLQLAEQGTIKTVELAGLGKAGKRKLDIPADAGVAITADIKADKNAQSIGLEITGDEEAVESIEVFDAGGTKISSGMSSWSFAGGPAHKSLDVNSPLDDTMKLVVKIAVNRKMTTVPFDLKDVALP